MASVLMQGDYVPDGKGGFKKESGEKALLCKILFLLSCRRGGFAPLPEVGSRLYLLGREKPSVRSMAARQYAAEALEGLDVTVEDAAVTMDENGIAHVNVKLTAAGEKMEVEVTA